MVLKMVEAFLVGLFLKNNLSFFNREDAKHAKKL